MNPNTSHGAQDWEFRARLCPDCGAKLTRTRLCPDATWNDYAGRWEHHKPGLLKRLGRWLKSRLAVTS